MGKTISWRPEQQKCITARGGTLLVSAAAGSGKTAVLVERIVSRITEEADPVAVDELLVVTFTNAAAAEMKKRLSDRLGDYLREHPTARGLRRQQLLLPTADVCTMDAFCQKLVRDNAPTLGLPADYKIADDAQLSFLKHDAFDEALTAAFEAGNRGFLHLYNTVENKSGRMLPQTVFSLHSLVFNQPDPQRFIDEQLARCSGEALPSDPLGEELPPLTGADRTHTARLQRALLRLVSDFDRRLREKKKEAGLLDFNDVLHLTLFLLAARDENNGFLRDEAGEYIPSAFATELSRRFREIYVDEYQDTNKLQDTLYRLLSQNEENLFFVGDAKQSIYGFRGTSPRAFLQRRDTYALSNQSEATVEHFPATVVLDRNFRSRKDTVDAINFLFDQLMQKECGDIDYAGQEELALGADYPEDEAGVFHPTLLLIDGDNYAEPLSSTELCELQAIAVAKEIKKMMQNPAVRVKSGDGTRAPEYRDFCILLRSAKDRDAIFAAALQKIGIPAMTGNGQNTFFEEVEIRWVLSLLRVIDNPLLDVSLLAVLMSPFYGFSPDDMTAIRTVAPHAPLFVALKQTAAGKNELAHRCSEFLNNLDTWRTLAATVPADRLLWDVYERTHLMDFCAIRKNGAAREQNLRLLLDHARSFEQNRFRGLSAFLRFFDRLCENGDTMATANVTGECQAVRIMTLHKSKGLEFPFVFLANIEKKFNERDLSTPVVFSEEAGIATKWLDEDTLEMHNTDYREFVIDRMRRAARSEEMRLLYVAATRAREKLYFVGAFDHLDKTLTELAKDIKADSLLPASAVAKQNAYGKWILLALLRHPCAEKLRERAGVKELQPLPDETPFDIIVTLPSFSEPTAEEEAPPPPSDETLKAMLHERFSYEYPHKALAAIPSKLAASAVTHSSRNHEYAAKAVPAFLQAEGLSAAEKGTATHAFMQFADWARAANDVAAERERLVVDGKLTRAQADAVDLPSVAAFFAHPLYARISAATRVWRELPFTYALSVGDYKKLSNLSLSTNPQDDIHEALLVQGIADCVFEENGALVILDYKTDHGKSLETLRDHYAPQLKLYAKALSELFELPVSSCLLYSFSNRDVVETDTDF